MSTDIDKLSYVVLTPEEIEWHVRHARQLRSEAIAAGVRQLIGGRRPRAGNLKAPDGGALCQAAAKRHAHGTCQ
jgi:hypothetical protein